MKLFSILILLTSCQLIQQPEESIKSVPGTYTRYSEHEFGIEYDTLVIKVMHKQNQFFTIERRWKYQRILDGKKLAEDYKLIKNTGRYIPASKQINVSETGETYYFNLKQKTILTGSIQYQKL